MRSETIKVYVPSWGRYREVTAYSFEPGEVEEHIRKIREHRDRVWQEQISKCNRKFGTLG